MSWTDERIERLRTLWSQGVTASQIAEDLGAVSRNAVIGKAHRLGLESRPSPVKGAETVAEIVSAPMPAAEEIDVSDERPADVEPEETPLAVIPPTVTPEPEEDDEPVSAAPAAPPPPVPLAVRSIGPGGFERQMPGETSSPIPPAPPRRLVPAKPSAEIANKTSLLELNDRICKWPLGHPGEPDFHFCGEKVNAGFPYCLSHCSVAYQAQLPRRDRRPPPPMPYGGPRVR